jgi:hypothetical protein
MTDFFSFLGWLFVNVGVPVLAPVTLLPLLRFNRIYGGDLSSARAERDDQFVAPVN